MGYSILFKQLMLCFGILISIITSISGCIPLSTVLTSCVLFLSSISLLANLSRKNAPKAMETCVRPEGFHQKGEEAGLVVESEKNVHKEDAQVLPFTNNKVHSESESIDDLSFNSGESEDDWDAPYNMGQEQANSDNLSSDEESLIEIALQSGNCVDYLSNQRRLKELLLEMSEEDNMIEIDIAVGSIKCSPS